MNIQKIVFTIFITSIWNIGLAHDTQHPDEINWNKYKVVSRTYELTTDMLSYCSETPSAQLQEHTAVINSFWLTYPFFHEQIQTSPYYNIAKRQIDENKMHSVKPYYEAYVKECKYYQELVQELIDSTNGQKSVNEMSNTLSTP